MIENVEKTVVDRTGLISVPLHTRPKPDEIRPYLRAFQAYILEQALELLDENTASHNSDIGLAVMPELRRLVTSLSTELEYVRLPIVWAKYKRLVSLEELVKEQALEGQYSTFQGLLKTTGVFLLHFDLVRHLSDAERRVANGDDRIDEALFVELDELVKDFDKTRAEIFSNEIERANRIKAVLALPSGHVPRYTVAVYMITNRLAGGLRFFARTMFPSFGAALVGAMAVNFLMSNTSVFESLRRLFDSLIGFP